MIFTGFSTAFVAATDAAGMGDLRRVVYCVETLRCQVGRLSTLPTPVPLPPTLPREASWSRARFGECDPPEFKLSRIWFNA